MVPQTDDLYRQEQETLEPGHQGPMLEIGKDHFYRSLCEHIGVALIATDLDLKIGLWNTAAVRMFGAGSERMIGTSITQIIPQERRELAKEMIQRVIETGETSELEFEYRDDRGGRRELAGTIAAIVSDSGEAQGASICFRDITRRMDLQDEVHENRKMVALGEMAGALSHHFNNILGGAITSIDYANATDDPNMKSRVLAHVETALQRATALMEGLLAFSASDHRNDTSANLTSLLEHIAHETQSELANGTISFELTMADLPEVSVSVRPVRTILRNIIRNAIESMPSGGSLCVRADRHGNDVVISISDTGCGLPKDSKSRIFEPFWSTKEMLTAESGEATGLGLAVAHGLARMLGGSIDVDSLTGEGSSFVVRLPLRS